jgi:hypothetical protein
VQRRIHLVDVVFNISEALPRECIRKVRAAEWLSRRGTSGTAPWLERGKSKTLMVRAILESRFNSDEEIEVMTGIHSCG